MKNAGEELGIHQILEELNDLYLQKAEMDEPLALDEDTQSDIKHDEVLISEAIPTLMDSKLSAVRKAVEEKELAEKATERELAKVVLQERIDAVEASPGLFWPIPTLLSREERNSGLVDGALSITEHFIDERLENEPINNEQIRKRLKDERLNTASIELASIFINAPSRVFTREELGEMLYSWDCRTEDERTTCVASLISMHENAKHTTMHDALMEKELVLQRGARRVTRKMGDGRVKVLKHRQPIFRAVPKELADSMTDTFTTIKGGEHIQEFGWVVAKKETPKGYQPTENTLALNAPLQEEIITPANTTEQRLVELMDASKETLEEGDLVAKDDIPVEDVWLFLDKVLGSRYVSVRTLRHSRAWRRVGPTIKVIDGHDVMSGVDAIALNAYGLSPSYMNKRKNMARAKKLIAQKVNEWRVASNLYKVDD
ncbi:MAG: hypothetical protein QG629_29 [Patescibacteria group bacterium]|nr:hypothetical protein [Candidatus Saccharibacteria bacterium]MDQ5962947.1 hypothetical protein [Patescibacteria group bacterium]